MGDIVLKQLNVGSEGPYTTGAALLPTNSKSVYANGGAAVAATRRMAVEDSTEFGYAELTYEAPEEARGTYAANYTHILHMRHVKGKFGALLYPDDLPWWFRSAIAGSPTVTTLPAAPQTVLASTAVTATAVSLAGITQPNAQADVSSTASAKVLVFVLSAGATNASAITFTVTGTDVNSNNITETIAFTAGLQTLSRVGGGVGATSCTLYSRQAFRTVSAITASSSTTGDSLAVQCVNGFLWTFTPDMSLSTLLSLTGEFFDGSTPWQLPGMAVDKFDIDIAVGKSVKISGDAVARDMVSMSALTALTDSLRPATSSYQARYYSDPIGATPGTTPISARLTEAKLSIANGLTMGKAADGTPLATFIGRKRYKADMEMTLLFQNGALGAEDPSDFAAFNSAYASKTVMVALPAVSYLPCGLLTPTLASTGWPSQLGDANNKGGLYGVTVAQAGKFTSGKPAAVGEHLAVKMKLEGEVDLQSMAATYQVQVVNLINPNLI